MRFLGRRRGRGGPHVTDVLSYLYLVVGVLVMFGPVAWLVLSSFKTQAALIEFPPSLLPMEQLTTEVEGYEQPLPVFDVAIDDGTTVRVESTRGGGLPGANVRVSRDQLVFESDDPATWPETSMAAPFRLGVCNITCVPFVSR